jgi:beta-galactosidase
VFGGLFRRVFLLVTGDVHVDALDYGGPGVYVSTEALTRSGAAQLLVRTRLRNDRAREARVTVATRIVDALGIPVAELRSPVRIPAQSITVLSRRVAVREPRLWRGVRDPHLYRAVTEVTGRDAGASTVLDRLETSFGIRTVAIDPERGFLLNGEPVALHGVNLFHSGRPGRGLAVTETEVREDMAILDELGITGVRFVHFQHPAAAYEEADRRGFIVWTEIPLNGAIDPGQAFERNIVAQMHELIRQNFNHPSVAVWGLGNEVYATGPEVIRVLERVQGVARDEDPNRPTAYAHCCQADDHAKALVSDVSAFNRYFGWYPDQRGTIGAWASEFHRKFPERAFAVSEYGAGASIRHQQDPPARPEPAGGWHPEQYQALLHETSWREIAPLDYLWGKFVWVAFDLASAGRSEGERPGVNDKGLITYDRAVRKDAFYWYQANWSDEPMLHLTSRRAALRTKPAVDVKAYSNVDAVRLEVNDREIGTARVIDRIARWEGVALRPGVNRIVIEASAGGQTLHDEATWTYVELPAAIGENLP